MWFLNGASQIPPAPLPHKKWTVPKDLNWVTEWGIFGYKTGHFLCRAALADPAVLRFLIAKSSNKNRLSWNWNNLTYCTNSLNIKVKNEGHKIIRDVKILTRALGLNFSMKFLKVKMHPKRCFLAVGFCIRTILTSHLNLAWKALVSLTTWACHVLVGFPIIPSAAQNNNNVLGCQVTDDLCEILQDSYACVSRTGCGL